MQKFKISKHKTEISIFLHLLSMMLDDTRCGLDASSLHRITSMDNYIANKFGLLSCHRDTLGIVRYKAKIKTCCKVLNCVLWNDPRLDFLEMSEKRVFKLVAQQWNWELQQPDSAIKKFLKSTLLKYGHTVDGNIFKKIC